MPYSPQLLIVLTISIIGVSIFFIWHVLSVHKFKKYVYDKDVKYTKRFNDLESILKTDLKSILEILKK